MSRTKPAPKVAFEENCRNFPGHPPLTTGTMRLAKIPLLAGLLGLLAMLSPLHAAAPESLHLSLTEATLNRERGRLLLTVRLQAADLEAALSARAGRKISAAEPGELAPLALEYVRENLRIAPARGNPARLEWAGHDVAEKQIFLFFEAPLIGGLEGTRIANTLLLDRLPDQVNSVELRDGAIKKTLVFSRDTTEHTVSTKP